MGLFGIKSDLFEKGAKKRRRENTNKCVPAGTQSTELANAFASNYRRLIYLHKSKVCMRAGHVSVKIGVIPTLAGNVWVCSSYSGKMFSRHNSRNNRKILSEKVPFKINREDDVVRIGHTHIHKTLDGRAPNNNGRIS